jgi:NTP pyrophosphatase (non-canonical NTP hydrolase)
VDDQRASDRATLRDYRHQLRQLEAACDEQGLQQVQELAEYLIEQIVELGSLLTQHDDLKAELEEAEWELASLNAIYGTSYRLACPSRRNLRADDRDVEILKQFTTFRDSLQDDELREAVEELKRCYRGKAKATARSRDRLKRRQIQLSRLDAFRAELGVA